jgi:phage terminase small subunit
MGNSRKPKRPPRATTLTPRQQAFVNAYLVSLNGAAAAVAAGYSAKAANVTAAKLVAKASVRAAIDAAMAKRAERTEVRAADVIRELSRVAFSDLTDVASWTADGGVRVKDSATLTEAQRRAVLSVRSKVRTIPQGDDLPPITEADVEVKLHPKIQAADLLAKHLGLYQQAGDMVRPETVRGFLVAVGRLLERWVPGGQVEPALMDLRGLVRDVMHSEPEDA